MSHDEKAIETEIQAKGLTAPRLTPALIDAEIKSEDYHVFGGTALTVCCLTLQNGFTVTGESACAQYADTVTVILATGADLARRIAAEADGHIADKIACATAWPK